MDLAYFNIMLSNQLLSISSKYFWAIQSIDFVCLTSCKMPFIISCFRHHFLLWSFSNKCCYVFDASKPNYHVFITGLWLKGFKGMMKQNNFLWIHFFFKININEFTFWKISTWSVILRKQWSCLQPPKLQPVKVKLGVSFRFMVEKDCGKYYI